MLASNTGAKIIKLREQHRNMLSKNMHGIALLDSLFDRPYLDIKRASEVMQCPVVTAGKVVREYSNCAMHRGSRSRVIASMRMVFGVTIYVLGNE